MVLVAWVEALGYPILTGGLVAITVELIHYGLRIRRRQKFVFRLRDLFTDLNKEIKNAVGSTDGKISRPELQFVLFRSKLDDIRNLIYVYSRHLKDRELSEIQYIINQEMRLIEMLRVNNKLYTEELYTQFFKRLLKLKWLKYMAAY